MFGHIFRLIAEKINKNERKSKAEIIVLSQGSEEKGFWKALNVNTSADIVLIKVSGSLFLSVYFSVYFFFNQFSNKVDIHIINSASLKLLTFLAEIIYGPRREKTCLWWQSDLRLCYSLIGKYHI